MIPYGRQDITQADIDAIVDVVKSDFLTQGPVVPQFEKAVSNHVGARHALAVNSATSALHLACLALDLGPGDFLWTSPITFVASANCGLYCGAKVDFVDIDSKTYNICPVKLEEKLKISEKLGTLPSVLVAVHLCGQACDMAAIYTLSERYGFKVIEDASHAVGGKYRGKFIGSCEYSDITVFSFHPVKIITTAEGGMALTNNVFLAEKMELLRSHGITRNESNMDRIPDGAWYYQQVALGFNYRMTELQAALGLSQVKRLDDYIAKRHQLAEQYDLLLSELPLVLPWQHPDTFSARHLYVIRLKLKEITKSHKQVFDDLRGLDIGVNLHYIPVYKQPYYQNLGYAFGDCPNALVYYDEAISLPIYPGLDKESQMIVVNALKKVLL